jgi:hypothetical protein
MEWNTFQGTDVVGCGDDIDCQEEKVCFSRGVFFLWLTLLLLCDCILHGHSLSISTYYSNVTMCI